MRTPDEDETVWLIVIDVTDPVFDCEFVKSRTAPPKLEYDSGRLNVVDPFPVPYVVPIAANNAAVAPVLDTAEPSVLRNPVGTVVLVDRVFLSTIPGEDKFVSTDACDAVGILVSLSPTTMGLLAEAAATDSLLIP